MIFIDTINTFNELFGYYMTRQTINLGSSINARDGDPIRTAFQKVNANFTELYTLTSGAAAELQELAQDYAAEMFVNGTHSGLTATYNDEENTLNLILSMNIDGGSSTTEYDLSTLIIDGGNA
jgi:hypothetical protein